MADVVGYLRLPSSNLFYMLIIQSLCCNANDTFNQTQQLSGDQTLVSARQIFEFGFFNPNGSSNKYLGIWYKKVLIPKIVWVANREHPLAANDTASTLKIHTDGNLRLLDGKQNTIWSTKVPVQSNNTFAMLHDNGNFILKDSLSGSILWESFNYPCDTLLPGMKVGVNRKSGEKLYLSSWKAENDPGTGKFETGFSVDEPPEVFTWNSSMPYWRSGPWDGSEFLGTIFDRKGYANWIDIASENQLGTVYMTYDPNDDSNITFWTLKPSGYYTFMIWSEQTNEWIERLRLPSNPCDFYGKCGAFGVGICIDNKPMICQCLKGFIPQSNEEWSKGNWNGGCVRRTPLLCEKNGSTSDIFHKVDEMKVPNNYAYLKDVNETTCEQMCLRNCSCVAYTYLERIGCMVWEGNLIDSHSLPHTEEGFLFLRLAYSEKDSHGEKRKMIILIISCTTVLIIILLVISIYYIRKWGVIQRDRTRKSGKEAFLGGTAEDQKFPASSTELPIIDFTTIAVSTNNFSLENKLGEGGFGPVYKGEMENGQHIAVKRLSNHSGQGNEEFKNEIILISKLQHRNLVKLLGCSIHGEEKLLVYEYLKNKSLDCYIFDPIKRLELNWTKRFHIIQGIARGILYLHRDSRLRVIHRDLKVSNVLLDDDMNPKISDFGLARTFKVTQELANTHRVVGTFGYMSPEYAIWGLFSEKSDVYSFGVLLLEIVSGRKNTGFLLDKDNLSLLDYAWKSWFEHQGSEFLDQSLLNSSYSLDVTRCIQIGLLCVQDHHTDRPTMADVVLMLSRETDLPQPKQPAFARHTWLDSSSGSPPNLYPMDSDDMSLLEGR